MWKKGGQIWCIYGLWAVEWEGGYDFFFFSLEIVLAIALSRAHFPWRGGGLTMCLCFALPDISSWVKGFPRST